MQKIDLSLLKSLITHFVDIQTSGLSSDSYIIEIGVFNSENTFSKLITPIEEWIFWDSEYQKRTHKITRKTLLKNGVDIVSICNHLNNEYKGLTLWTDSNNKESYIEYMFICANMIMDFKIKNIYNVIPPQYGYSLLQEINKNVTNRALSDAKNICFAWNKFVILNSI